jgi:hypothetical protein
MPSLTDIALQMRRKALNSGIAITNLSGGLVLSLIHSRTNGPKPTWALTSSRKNKAPSPTEIRVLRDAFHVPSDGAQTCIDTSVTLTWPA